ncbi:MAG: O-antigen ligase family protein [Terriglobia bacterium]
MGFPLALLICSVGIAGLFILNRDKSIRTSPALWLTVIWLWIIGSRPVSAWLGPGSGGYSLDATLEGSPTDAFIFTALIAVGIIVLVRRRKRAKVFLKASLPVLIYFAYCLLSLGWSPIPDVAFKRWIKATGDVVMVLIVVTDVDPIAALRRLFSRVGFILFPASIVLIRYTDLGRGYTPDGQPMNTGVTTNKNTLGLVVFVIGLGVLWGLRALLRDRDQPHRRRRLLAQFTLLAFVMALLQMAHSATSVACFVLGSTIMLLTGLRVIRRSPAAVRTVVLTIALTGGLAYLSGADEMVIRALGRKPDLTGRTDIWKAIIPMARNPIIGVGYESFWNSMSQTLSTLDRFEFGNLVSAHNGYLDIYLNIGLVGVGLVALILIHGYLRASVAFRRDPGFASLILCYIATAAIYSVTEAGFKPLCPMWFFLLLSVIGAGGIAAGVAEGAPEHLGEPADRAVDLVTSDTYGVGHLWNEK